MAAYTGTIRFISYEGDKALVTQQLAASAFEDGYRFVKNATFGAKAVGDTINYDYVGGFTEGDNAITIS